MSKPEAPAAPNSKVMYIIAGVAVAFVAYSFLFDGGGEQAVEKPGQPVAVERGSDPINDIGSIDRDAALAQFNKKIQLLTSQLEESEAKRVADRKELESTLREQNQQNNKELRQLAETVDELNKADVNAAYNALNSVDKGTGVDLPGDIPDSGLSIEDFDLGGSPPIESQQSASLSQPYGPNYFVLNPNRLGGLTSKPAGGADMYATEDELFKDMSSPDASPTTVDTSSSTTQASPGAEQPTDPNQAQNIAEIEGETKPRKYTDNEGVTREKYDIPAFSYVEVTTLHGVACPIGASSPNTSSGGSGGANMPNARPVVIPVRGVFHGPNNATRDLGTAHLMGLCSGNRTASASTGRGTIRIEQLSYWDEYGKPQHVPALGYIVDQRDNQQDVYGRLEQASGRTLALQSAAAAAAAYASTLSQSEFSNSTTLNADGLTNTQSTLTGDATKAAVNQGIAAMFTTIGKRFEAEANAMFDTVIIEPGIKLQFITEQPISVYKAAEPFDIDAGRYDVLL